jgi:lipoprotein NlpI
MLLNSVLNYFVPVPTENYCAFPNKLPPAALPAPPCKQTATCVKWRQLATIDAVSIAASTASATGVFVMTKGKDPTGCQGRGLHRRAPSRGPYSSGVLPTPLPTLSFHHGNTARAALRLLTGVILSVLLSLAVPALGASWKGASWKDASWMDHNQCLTGRGDVAIASCTAVINDAPESAIRARAYFNRGNAWSFKGDNDRGIADYTEAILLDPKNADAFNNRGNAWLLKGDNDRAIADYTEPIRLDPTNGGAFNNRCWAGAVTGQLEQALEDCETSLTLRPSDPNFLDSRALVHLKRNDFKQAIADYDAALKIDPKKAHSFYGRGLAKQKMGDTAGGNADIAAATSMDGKIAERFSSYGVK